MHFFRPIRLLALIATAAVAFQTASAQAATKSHGKKSSSKKSVKHSSGKRSASQDSSAKAPRQKIDLAKLEPVESLYRKHEAVAPASRNLSFFGSLASSYHYDSRMMHAAEIASSRAYAHSRGSCWRYVKNALLDAGVVDSRPKTAYAKEAASELTNDFGFKRISCNDPLKAPLGSVIVYGGAGAGHIEFRTKTGFVSDFTNVNPSKRPLIGVYVKP